MMRLKTSSLLVLSLVAAACGSPARPASIALTHQWAVPAGTSLFTRVSLGASPERAADALMGVMPTIVHRLGERCQEDEGAAAPGEFLLSFALRAGKASSPRAEPLSPLAACVLAALPEAVAASAAELGAPPPVEIVLHLEHAPVKAPG